MTTTVQGISGLKAKVGEHLGYSKYVEITQEQVNLFADATGDHQWIHVDPERAKSGPFGGAIAHGYLTLSMGPRLMPEIRWERMTAPELKALAAQFPDRAWLGLGLLHRLEEQDSQQSHE